MFLCLSVSALPLRVGVGELNIHCDHCVFLFFFQLDVFDAAERYRQSGVSLIVLAGKEYGSGSSRDWAAKGPFLLVS